MNLKFLCEPDNLRRDKVCGQPAPQKLPGVNADGQTIFETRPLSERGSQPRTKAWRCAVRRMCRSRPVSDCLRKDFRHQRAHLIRRESKKLGNMLEIKRLCEPIARCRARFAYKVLSARKNFPNGGLMPFCTASQLPKSVI